MAVVRHPEGRAVRSWREWLAGHPSVVVAAGFTAVLILMAVLIGLVFSRVQLLRGALDQVVAEHNRYTAETFRMLDIARRRGQTLQRIVSEEDPFVRDAHIQQFNALANEFAAARLRFLRLELSPAEQAAMVKLSGVVGVAREAQGRAIALAEAGNTKEAQQVLFRVVMPAEARVYDGLGELIRAQQDEVAEDNDQATRYEQQARWYLLAGGGFTLLFSAVLAWFATYRLRGLIMAIQRHAANLEQTVEERTAEVREREAIMRQMTAAANDAVVMIDDRDIVTFWNPAAERIFGYAAENAIGRHLHDLIMPPRFREAMARAFVAFAQTGKGNFVGRTREVVALRSDGSEFPAELSLATVQVKGRWHAIGLARDISDRKQAEHALHEAASTDALTGVGNRRKFDKLLENEAKRAARYDLPLTLVLIDIDRFKVVNDTYGHLVGDTVLTEIARLISDNIRANDHFARWGGEEFALLATHSDEMLTGYLCEKLCALVAVQSFNAVGQVTCSFGVAELRPSDTVQTLIERADAALYRAKALGRNRVCLAADLPS